jgi:hypothetical protein
MVAAMIVIFAIAAVAGVILAALHFSGKNLPMALALFHGVFAVVGVILLILGIMKLSGAGILGGALALFVVAALGGLTLFFGFYLRRKKLSTPIVGLHALFAVIGFLLVIVYAASH